MDFQDSFRPNPDLDKLASIYNNLISQDEHFFSTFSPEEIKVCEKIKKFMEGRGSRVGEELKAFDQKKIRKIIDQTASIEDKIAFRAKHPKEMDDFLKHIESKRGHKLHLMLHKVNSQDLPDDVWHVIAENISDKDQENFMLTERKFLKAQHTGYAQEKRLIQEIAAKNVELLLKHCQNFFTGPGGELSLSFDEAGQLRNVANPYGRNNVVEVYFNEKGELGKQESVRSLGSCTLSRNSPSSSGVPSLRLSEAPSSNYTIQDSFVPLPRHLQIVVEQMVKILDDREVLRPGGG